MFLDLEAGVDWIYVYRLCIGFISPRPIALVSTVSPDGRANLAPFSFYNMVCAKPPTVMFSAGTRRDGAGKDTLRNIESVREFVVATATDSFRRQMVDCAADLPYGESEFDFSGLTPTPAARVRPARVRESPVNIECRLTQIVRLGSGAGGASAVFGEIVAIDVADAVLDADRLIDPHRLDTVGRLGGQWYCTVRQPYELQIPKRGERPKR